MKTSILAAEVLKELYTQFNKKAPSLSVQVKCDDLAKTLSEKPNEISPQEVNRSIHYLRSKKLLSGDIPGWSDVAIHPYIIFFTHEAIDLCDSIN